MTDTLFQRVDASAKFLVSAIDQGEYGLPDLQRPFVWKRTKVRDLLDSMYRGYPVGFLMLWKNPVHSGAAKQIGTDSHNTPLPSTLIIDGQQRLTSLYAVMKGRPVLDKNFREQRVAVAFHPLSETFKVANAALSKSPEWIADVSEIFGKGAYSSIKDYLDRLSAAREVAPEEQKRAEDSIQRLSGLENYPFSALEITAETDEEQVADIFVRVNSQGQKLKQSDFILTLLSVFWADGRQRFEAFAQASRTESAKGKPSPRNHHIEPSPDQLLRVAIAIGLRRGRLRAAYQFLRGKNPETGKVTPEERDLNLARLESAQKRVLDLTRWHDYLKALVAAGFRSRRQIASETAILFGYVFYLIGRDECGVPPGQLRRLIGRFFFMASLTSRYSTSTETTLEEDLARLRGVETAEDFVAALERTIAAALTSDFWTINLPDLLATSSSQSAALGAYHAAQNLLDARVLFSQSSVRELLDPMLHAPRSALERHHLFPKAYLRREGFERVQEINQIANFALVEWADNAAIADRPPAEYVPALESGFDSIALARMYADHGLFAGWHTLSYTEFLERRRAQMAQVIRRGFEALLPASSHESL